MSRLYYILPLLFLLIQQVSLAQNGRIYGELHIQNAPTPCATVKVLNSKIGAITDSKGKFELANLPLGTFQIEASYVGYKPVVTRVMLSAKQPNQKLILNLTETNLELEGIVVTGTKTVQRQKNSPILVNILTSKTLSDVQACNLSEGLKFQPGLRVETDCQTCNYTQLRINGLGGGYSQILINGRPIFSPLTGLYGLEQMPTNMIDRIEVVRGGGSSLYGSSAIGGTVNVITKILKSNSSEISFNLERINNQANASQLTANTTVISEERNAGISLFFNKRNREFYDHNDDHFSELPKLENTAFGASFFLLPKENQKLEVNLSYLNEYRFGGEMINKPAFLTQQAEERMHSVWMGSADYQINFNKDRSSLIAYAAWQNTDRKHYTGIFPDDSMAVQNHLEHPPYGTSLVTTYNVGLQLNHRLTNFIRGENVLTLGAEFISDDVLDEIPAYNYLIDQYTLDIGFFAQSDWKISPNISLLSGVRVDKHNLLNNPVLSPRASLLIKKFKNTQLRISYGSGFRAPQAFDTDLHLAFAGGGVSRVALSPFLLPEKSQSFSGSYSYDKLTENYAMGLTLEGFYTFLNQAFVLQPLGEDNFGQLFEKQNGSGANVQGITLETRYNYKRKIQLETGVTLQQSMFTDPVQYIAELDGIRQFIRTPNSYGFATLQLTPVKKWNAYINGVYTGKMIVPHFAGAPNQLEDEMKETPTFFELGSKIAYTISSTQKKPDVELYIGIKNALNAYQNSFDIGKNRDSNFIYGPAQPRNIFGGLKIFLK